MNWPGDDDRQVIVGATGSGKTQGGVWQLSHRRFDLIPWVILNFKNDELIDGIPGAFHMPMTELPARPGVYVAHPLPHEGEQVEHMLWEMWRRGDIGLFVDEGYMIDRNSQAFRALQTQGRSRGIPIITLSQRPVYLDKFAFTEAGFWQVFRLQNAQDIKSVEEYVPADLSERLPKYHSYYYDVGENQLYRMRPVPEVQAIYGTFARRLGNRKVAI